MNSFSLERKKSRRKMTFGRNMIFLAMLIVIMAGIKAWIFTPDLNAGELNPGNVFEQYELYQQKTGEAYLG